MLKLGLVREVTKSGRKKDINSQLYVFPCTIFVLFNILIIQFSPFPHSPSLGIKWKIAEVRNHDYCFIRYFESYCWVSVIDDPTNTPPPPPPAPSRSINVHLDAYGFNRKRKLVYCNGHSRQENDMSRGCCTNYQNHTNSYCNIKISRKSRQNVLIFRCRYTFPRSRWKRFKWTNKISPTFISSSGTIDFLIFKTSAISSFQYSD